MKVTWIGKILDWYGEKLVLDSLPRISIIKTNNFEKQSKLKNKVRKQGVGYV